MLERLTAKTACARRSLGEAPTNTAETSPRSRSPTRCSARTHGRAPVSPPANRRRSGRQRCRRTATIRARAFRRADFSGSGPHRGGPAHPASPTPRARRRDAAARAGAPRRGRPLVDAASTSRRRAVRRDRALPCRRRGRLRPAAGAAARRDRCRHRRRRGASVRHPARETLGGGARSRSRACRRPGRRDDDRGSAPNARGSGRWPPSRTQVPVSAVQAGLFDRRALRLADAARELHASLQRETTVRLDDLRRGERVELAEPPRLVLVAFRRGHLTPHMLTGVSGSLVSEHFAETSLESMFGGALGEPTRDAAWRELRRWGRRQAACLGPVSSARAVYDAAAVPLARALGFDPDLESTASDGSLVLSRLGRRHHGSLPRDCRLGTAARRRLAPGRPSRRRLRVVLVLLHQRPIAAPRRRSTHAGARVPRVRPRVRPGRRGVVPPDVGPAASREPLPRRRSSTASCTPRRATRSASAGR